MQVRIYQPVRTATQQGQAQIRKWVLEFEPASPAFMSTHPRPRRNLRDEVGGAGSVAPDDVGTRWSDRRPKGGVT